eukprot:CAMPEP_0117021180 /NCGR_PEP_ID=MMETSP0472-20121206/16006_1 /TAXON_ID=693140 ORGANISM="Tiarina fusus, Strain LIS" /NCGR_SAMPLE_ID=MMETSP0472 /ASSEMBLY_ACC=CAM_ASM_000603 /LENGTH=149 /DNA_ID=CAMNT_0004726583 /DNA_START=160 /DNA_END=609 /DNA_ORIENTATION=+
MNIPIVVTEQYPKAFGRTVEELKVPETKDNIAVFAKTKFSMCTDEVKEHLEKISGIEQVILCGIETHVCVQQTTLDLLQQGIGVHLIADGVSSGSNKSDRVIAIEALRQSGAFVTSCESVVFELLRDSKNEHFKEVSAILKEPRVDVGL